MNDVYVVAARRTAIGRLNGAFTNASAVELGTVAVAAALVDSGVPKNSVSELVFGHVLTAGLGQNPARQTSLAAGLPVSVPAMTVNMVCGSGQRAIQLAAQSIRSGDAAIMIAGGQENMTRAPHALSLRRGLKVGDVIARDTVMSDGLTDAMNAVPMGNTAELVARRYGIGREEQDVFALRSQQKAQDAISSGRFNDEIAPVDVREGRQTRRVETDEHPTPGTSLDALSRLRPAFDSEGTVTPGNASGINDGAAAVILASGRKVKELDLRPMARVVSFGVCGIEPMEMGLGPIGASRDALRKAGWTSASLDLIELNEAFAAQSLAVIREMDWNPATVNVNGGAIALGHPIGASGCRIVVTLLHELVRRQASRGLATLCVGGGMGVAICLEAV